MPKPLVLVVDDDAAAREMRSMQLARVDCVPVAVSSSNDALRQLWNTPMLSAVITDINLVNDGADKSGVTLARYIRKNRPELPLFGYSSFFAERALPESDTSLFDGFLSEATRERIKALISTAAHMASEFSLARRLLAEDRLRGIGEATGDVPNFERFRQLVPDKDLGIEQALAAEGWHAQVIGPSVFSEHSESTRRIAIPVLIWTRRDDEGATAEMHGVPELYAFGESEDAAIKAVFQLAESYYDELDRDSVAGPLKALSDFLTVLFRTDGE